MKQQLERARKLGFVYNTGPELEFFLFKRDAEGEVQPLPHDMGGYFDLTADLAAHIRKEMVNTLGELGISVETSHHEVAIAQHEIDFTYDNALRSADNAVTLSYSLKAIAQMWGLHATFMP